MLEGRGREAEDKEGEEEGRRREEEEERALGKGILLSCFFSSWFMFVAALLSSFAESTDS